ncbi:MAG: sulfite oxidase [Alphaproteobacteria bacterium]|nr:sulfite oxidase [Alphaproteobacteria bacterium]
MRRTATTRSLFALYREDPDKADRLLFGRVTHPDRRGFLRNAGLAAMAALVGGTIPFHRTMPAHLIPVALADAPVVQGKDGLVVLNDLPFNAETPAHLLDDAITPTERHFVRNNGVPPQTVDASTWALTVDGLVETPLTLGIDDLTQRFEVVTRALTLECAGNGRAFFDPPATGAQWTYGAVACSEWTGVRLADVLKAAGVKSGVVYTAHEGADTHPSGVESGPPISRGVPIAKALDPDSLVAFAQNGQPIHPMNGAPLRLVFPGWPGSCSQKWLTRVWLRDRVHDGAKMTGTSYRVPGRPVAPGEHLDETDFVIIGAMPVKSLITHPATGHMTAARALEVRGHAWAGEWTVDTVSLSIDFGATWTPATLDEPVNAHAWQNWRAAIEFPGPGYYEIWARATDSRGVSQPHAIAWNPRGYLNNAMHRVAVTVA